MLYQSFLLLLNKSWLFKNLKDVYLNKVKYLLLGNIFLENISLDHESLKNVYL